MTDPSTRRHRLSVAPSERHARVALRESLVVMAPLVRWLLRHGVHFSAFADALKGVFVTAARDELQRSGARTTDSAVSVLSGVHRKDVRALGDAAPAPPRTAPLASQVFTRWLTDPRFCTRPGHPATLARSRGGASFEALARELSTDVHPRTVLDELVRLGLVVAEADRVVPQAEMFVPAQGLDELAALFAANVADHIATAVHNTTLPGPKLLEHSVFASALTPRSAQALGEEARALWAHAFEAMVAKAQARVDADAGAADASTRIRFGVYFYAEPEPGAAPPPAAPRD